MMKRITVLTFLHKFVFVSPIIFLECQKKEETNQYFPIVALGQILWAFIKEPLLANLVRTWLFTFITSRYFENCPSHPWIFLLSPQ